MKKLLCLGLLLWTVGGNAQTVSRLVSWKYDFISNPWVTGFELIYYSGSVTSIVALPLVTSYTATLNIGQWYDFEIRATCASLPGIKSPPDVARHLPLPAPPTFNQTNILLSFTNAMYWQKSTDFQNWLSAPVTDLQINQPIEWPFRFFRLAGGAAASNKIVINRTL